MFFLIKRLRAYLGHDKYSAETFDRLTRSMHVQDLRWIANVTVGAAGLAILIFAVIAWETAPTLAGSNLAGSKLYDALLPFTISAILAGLGGIIAWCYQTGSGRLGIVDLFACEITTLCRVCTVNGLADTCIAAFELDTSEHSPSDQVKNMRERFSHFESSEAYTPIFDANAKELQNLSVKVVINITAFYTYWKATRDAFRRLAKTQPTTEPAPFHSDGWHRAMANVLYMQFLATESARKAVRDLIEFEPNNAENTIMILIGELPLYGSLLKYFPETDVRYVRLQLRRSRYLSVVPQVYYHTLEERAKYNNPDTRNQLRYLSHDDLEELRRDWNKAYRMLDELKKRYVDAIGEEFPPREANRAL
jgi:hypothetical protein